MDRRLMLHTLLEGKLGSNQVYFQPPSNVMMRYPAIVYELSDIDMRFANDGPYKRKKRYSLKLITSDPDSATIDEILTLPYCSFDRHYRAENLNHYAYQLYF